MADPALFCAEQYTVAELECAAVTMYDDAPVELLKLVRFRPSFETRPRRVIVDGRRLPARAPGAAA